MVAVDQQSVNQIIANHLFEELEGFHRPVEVQQGEHHACLHRNNLELQGLSNRVHYNADEPR